MIKKANDNRNFFPSLSSAKPRGGLLKVGRLAELLIKQYEIQAELREQQKRRAAPAHAGAIAEVKTNCMTQATFTWFE